jgi:hypothetical protein
MLVQSLGLIKPESRYIHLEITGKANIFPVLSSVGNLSLAMGVWNQVGIGLSYRPARLSSLATKFQTRFLVTIPRPIAGLKISTQLTANKLNKCKGQSHEI